MRINKYIANAINVSRRKADEIICNGEISVNNIKLNKNNLGLNVESSDLVKYKNKEINYNFEKVYFLLNKPRYTISSFKDEKQRKTIYDLIDYKDKLFSIGRLDYETSGLIILTNDGDFANKVTLPHNNIKKTYFVKLNKILDQDDLIKLEKGIIIDNYKTKPCKIKKKKIENNKSYVEIILSEGKNRQVRKMFASLGYDVEKLSRTKIGKLTLGKLKAGNYIKIDKIHALEALEK